MYLFRASIAGMAVEWALRGLVWKWSLGVGVRESSLERRQSNGLLVKEFAAPIRGELLA